MLKIMEIVCLTDINTAHTSTLNVLVTTYCAICMSLHHYTKFSSKENATYNVSGCRNGKKDTVYEVAVTDVATRIDIEREGEIAFYLVQEINKMSNDTRFRLSFFSIFYCNNW